MLRGRTWRALVCVTLTAALLGVAPIASLAKEPVSRSHDGGGLYVPPPNEDGFDQVAALRKAGDRANSALLARMLRQPQAVWIESGTQREAELQVRKVMKDARKQGTVPVLVAYNIPFRDCAQFSAGGATTVEEYEAWIDGFASGLGNGEAMVILEPDGLGIIPWYKQFRGTPAEAAAYEWCQPAEAVEATAADDRFAMLNYAVDALKAHPNVKVYLDGTHSSWLGSGDAAHRLIQAGVERADGFFVNVSNYRLTEHLVKYGQWTSDCIYLSQNSWWQVEWCASQYFPANPNDFSTWGLTDAAYDQAFADTGLTRNPAEQAHFVVDTSRNGQGPWTPPSGVYPDPQDWCNPPNRGAGLRPTLATGNPLIDAYLWVKIPGESDGQCTRGLGPTGTPDPEWVAITGIPGFVDPAAGQWFPQQALQLAQLANPPLA